MFRRPPVRVDLARYMKSVDEEFELALGKFANDLQKPVSLACAKVNIEYRRDEHWTGIELALGHKILSLKAFANIWPVFEIRGLHPNSALMNNRRGRIPPLACTRYKKLVLLMALIETHKRCMNSDCPCLFPVSQEIELLIDEQYLRFEMR
ncbi:uncharacterized protein RAG0_14500 [Rhynchosporium agropyri]|uniref:Uncharacterized protein n=1 Tax=Rhynchosporium agropyri TaxID=914238 RepID=A0A1E1LH88_9HELO|nr:uncharacterized protein RAG0_14500 [Rhynchosporium agropyri]